MINNFSTLTKLSIRAFFSSGIKKQKSTTTDPVINNNLNSIAPSKEEAYAYGHYFPKDWTEQFIKKTLDPKDKNIELIQSVKNQLGEPTGKILFKFKNDKILEEYIKKYHEDYILTDIESQRVVILPFELKTLEKKKALVEGKNLKNPVRISNLDFDID